MHRVNMAIHGILPIAVLASGCSAPHVRPAPFRIRPDSVDPGDLRGPFDGRVVDAENGRPISGANAYAAWNFVDGGPAGTRTALVVTDVNGRYAIPKLKSGSGTRGTLSDFHLVIYKSGYVAYRSDRRFEDFSTRTEFAQKANQVKLDRWRSDLSHVKHLRYVGGGPILAELTRWEVREAAAELAGQAGPAETQHGPLRSVPDLDAEKYLRPADVAAVTSFSGTFDTSDLAGEPATPDYDSVHLRARDLPETHDVAARIWHLDPDEAEKHFERLASELPQVVTGTELGDRTLQAASEAGDIVGAGFLDRRRGLVVLVQCGSAQCKTHEQALAIAKRIKERLEADFPLRGEP